MTALEFKVLGTDRTLRLGTFSLVVAGYTGRDEAAVQHHIDELAAVGVPPPETVPAFYPLDSALATQADTITVAGTNTSGEVEPVLIVSEGLHYLTVGSDHTDRDLERTDIAASKAACPKPLGRVVVALDEVPDWDAVAVASTVDGQPYQEATLAALRHLHDVLDRSGLAGAPGPVEDLVMFGGTVPLLDGRFVAGRRWELCLTVPGAAGHADTTVTLRYEVDAPNQ